MFYDVFNRPYAIDIIKQNDFLIFRIYDIFTKAAFLDLSFSEEEEFLPNQEQTFLKLRF